MESRPRSGSTKSIISASLNLVSREDRRRLFLVVLGQSALAILDVAAVLTLGFVAAAATALTRTSGTSTLSIPGTSISVEVSISLLIMLTGLASILLVTKTVGSFFLTRRVFRFLASRQVDVAERLTGQLLSRGTDEVESRSSQETAATLTHGVSAAILGVIGNAQILGSELILLTFLGIGLAFANALLTLGTILYFGLIGLGTHLLFSRWTARLGDELQLSRVGSIVAIQEALQTHREVALRRGVMQQLGDFSAIRMLGAKAEGDSALIGVVTKYFFEIALILGAAVVGFASFATMNVAAAAGTLALFMAAASRMMPSVLRAQSALLQIRNSGATAEGAYSMAERFAEGVGSNPFPLEDSKCLDLNYLGASMEVAIEKVTFSYVAGAPILRKVSLRIEAGASMAIVGPSGSGKSTLIDLILGMRIPDSGSILIGGLSPANAVRRWPGAIALVPQEATLVEGSVLDNLVLGLPEALRSEELAWKALERAHLAAFLRSQRAGLETRVGESGLQLSGGQRQRLGIARALYTSPRLLILDEATSALDAETEASVTETLNALMGSLTLIVIAHRLSTVQHCDSVAYLSDGEVLATGSFDEIRRAVPDFDRHAALLGL